LIARTDDCDADNLFPTRVEFGQRRAMLLHGLLVALYAGFLLALALRERRRRLAALRALPKSGPCWMPRDPAA
jgi:hypothetical protein